MQSKDETNSSSVESSVEELSDDSDIEDDVNNDWTAFSAKYMSEITTLLGANSHVNCENALLLNQEMQQRLQEVRKRLQALLQAVKQRYLANEQRITLNMAKKQRGFGIRGAYLKGGTFFFKGNMYFKDLNCRNCPNNQDYEYRKNVEGEIFPMDFELCSRHVWSLLDKKAMVQAVKEQVIDYLSDRKSYKKKNKSKDLPLQIQAHTEKLSTLLAKVDDKFEIDWEEVSAHNLKYRHTPSSCKTMWQVYLHPSLRRNEWTAEENRRLLQAAQKYNYQNWESISKEVSKRSDYQCFIQYQTAVCFNDPKRWRRWDKRDDAKLLEIVQKKTTNGVVDWCAVASYFPHKPKKSLHQRYIYYLNPKISHQPFTAEEDLILLAAVEDYGEKFALFPRDLFPNRSIVQLRQRYKYTLKTRHKIVPWSIEDDRKLMEFVAEHGTSSWSSCADLLGNHSRMSCRTRFLTIQKCFAKDPYSTLEDIPRKKICVLRNSVITTENWVEKVTELRENPDTVLIPPVIRIRNSKKRAGKVAQRIVKKIEKLPKCEPQIQESTSKKKVIPYIERLRAVEQKLYHFFKYAYNFRLGTDVCTKPPNALLCEVGSLLDFQPDTAKQYKPDPLLSSYIGRRCKFYLWEKTKSGTGNFFSPFAATLPPSWSTALAFRALCVQSAQVQAEEKHSDKNGEDQKPNVEINEHIAVQRFRNRMNTILFQTALLSRLEPARFEQLKNVTPSSHTMTNASNTTDNTEVLGADITLSAFELSVHQKQETHDLSCVKNEFPTEYLSNSACTLPRADILKKGKLNEKISKTKPKVNKRKSQVNQSITNACGGKKKMLKLTNTENVSQRKTQKSTKTGRGRQIKAQKSASTIVPASTFLLTNSSTTVTEIIENVSQTNFFDHVQERSLLNQSCIQQKSINTYAIKEEHCAPKESQPELSSISVKRELAEKCVHAEFENLRNVKTEFEM